MSKTPVHFLEVIWITVAVICFALGIKAAVNHQVNNSLIFLLFTAIAITMYFLRRSIRKKDTSDR